MRRLKNIGIGLSASLGLGLVFGVNSALAASATWDSGNTATLDAQAVPDSPNFGYLIINNKLYVLLLITVMSTIGLILMSRYYSRLVSVENK